MAGGTWIAQNKVRPGVYIRFKSAAASNMQAGDRGIVAICEPLSWGPIGQIIEVDPNTDLKALTGYDITDSHNRFLAEIFKGTNRTSAPKKVLLWRPSATSSAAATVTTGNLTATAQYAGAFGNNISIIITLNTSGTDYTVSTVVDGNVEDIQVGATVADLEDNGWVKFTGSGALAATTGAALTGGADGTVASAAHTAFLTALEAQKFDIVCYDGTDSTTMAAYINFIKRIADENGQYAQLVCANATTPDSRFVINVVSGVTLDDGTNLTADQVTWWVSGAQAGAQYNESLTYASYPGAAFVNPAKTNSQILTAISSGQLVLNSEDGVVKIETDIDSLTTYSDDIGKVFRKNRVMRLCNQIANDIYATFSQSFVGVVNNDAMGRSRFKAVIVSYLTGIQANRGIQNFSGNDVEVLPGDDIDSVVVNLAIQPVDAIEKIYVTIEVR